jgi:AbrB family looped-hinge helix DNA binding protein
MTKIVSVNGRGSLTLPKDVRNRLGIAKGGQVILDVNESGEVSLRPGAVFPVEIYSEVRIKEFEAMNNGPLEGRKLRFRKAK